MKKNYKTILFILLLIITFFFGFYKPKNTNQLDRLQKKNDSILHEIKKRDIILKFNANHRLKTQDSIQLLLKNILTLEKEDSIKNIKFKKTIKEFRNKLSNLSSSDLSKLMIQKYEEITNN